MYVIPQVITPTTHSSFEKQQTAVPNYQVYMLRVWRENSSSSKSLRLTVEDTRSGNRVGFTDWDEFATYLHGTIDGEQVTSEAGEPLTLSLTQTS